MNNTNNEPFRLQIIKKEISIQNFVLHLTFMKKRKKKLNLTALSVIIIYEKEEQKNFKLV